MFELKPLPFALSALEPHISARTLEFHYGKHHQTYVDNLNKLIAGTDLENLTLSEIIKNVHGDSAKIAIFNNAAQVYNHDFFWQSLTANPSNHELSEHLKAMIDAAFGSLEEFKEKFKAIALTQFGSGWTWLVLGSNGLEIIKTANADNPLTLGVKPLLTVDVWEHAYYLDYQNRRADFVSACLNLFNWSYAESLLQE